MTKRTNNHLQTDRTDNTMTKRKNNDLQTGQTIQ